MNEILNKFIDDIKDQGFALIRDETKAFLTDITLHASEFSKTQHQKIVRYLTQLAEGTITKPQLEDYMLDIQDLTEMEITKNRVATKASAQRIQEGLKKLIFEGLLKVL